MEAARQKKLRSARIIATNVFMGISVAVIVAVLILLAMGYSFNKDGGIEQSGLIRINSTPRGATVELDGEVQSSRTEMSKMLSAGEHTIVISKPGYDTWQRVLNVESGLLTRVDWARLFPLERAVETVNQYESLRLMSVSPDNQFLMFLTEDSAEAQLINIKNDDIRYSSLDFGAALRLASNEVPEGELTIVQWNKNSDKFLLKYVVDETISWVLVDVKNPSNSINLSEKYLIGFDEILIASNAADKLWAREKGNLRLINVSDLTISGVLLDGIEAMANDAGVVAYVRTDKTAGRLVGVYKEGEQGGTTVQKIDTNITVAQVAIGTYWGDNWVAFSLDNRLFVQSGSFPSYGSTASSLKTIAEHDISFSPKLIDASPSGRFVVAINDDQVVAMDAELQEYWEYAVDSEWGAIKWLDNFMTWEIIEEKLVVRDFDGNNRREISKVEPGMLVSLTANNRWLYLIAPLGEGEKYTLQRERL
jgi:hypothetical protein